MEDVKRILLQQLQTTFSAQNIPLSNGRVQACTA
jgi:hypothetical protein